MSATIPGMEAKDVTDFHFRQMTRYQLQNDEDQVMQFPRTPTQRLTVSNKLGKIFAACKNALVSVDVSLLEKADELASNVKASSITPSKMVKSISMSNGSTSTALPSTPSHLGINADEKILAVVLTLQSTGKPHIYLYDTRSFSNEPSSNKPFMEIPPASPPGVSIVELAWNPVLPSMLAVVFSDGSLALHMINDKGFDSATLPPAEKIGCVSWSPKGKQLVAGKLDGSLTQYKPDLKEAKTIPKPIDPNNPGQTLSACSILWASTYQFLVLFKNSSNQASLYLVQSSKTGETKHYNYEDICYSTGDLRDPYFMMYHQMDWPLIVCASANGIEVALMGSTALADASWQQWNLEDAGRAELPLVTKSNEERYPVGMAFCTGGVNRCLPIDEAGNCMPHSVPILFLLAPDGLLCGFYALHKGAVKITKPTESVEGTVRPGVVNLPAATQPFSTNIAQLQHAPAAGGVKLNLHDKFQAIDEETKLKSSIPSTGLSKSSNVGFPSFGIQPTQPGKPVIASTPIKTVGLPESLQDSTKFGSQLPKLGSDAFLTPKSKSVTSAAQIKPAITTVEATKIPTGKNNSVSTNNDTTSKNQHSETRYQELIREEILSFEKELAEFKSRATDISIDVGSQDEKVLLKKGLVDMDGFRKLLIETTSSQCREISQLKKLSLENCQWLEEAKSRQTRNKDPRYLQLLKGRSLDPHSQKQLAKVQSKFMYLDQQIDEINNKLDLEWEAHCRKTNLQVTGRGNARRLQNDAAPSMETIYKVLHNHHGIIEKHKNECENLAKSIKVLNLNNISSGWQASKAPSYRRSARIVDNDELTKLADSLMEKTLLNENSKSAKESNQSFSGKACALSPIVGFSPEKESKLKQLLAEKGTTKIVPKQANLKTSINNSHTSPEKASKSLLSSLDKYKEVTVVSESPKSTTSRPTLATGINEYQVDKKPTFNDMQSGISIHQTKAIISDRAHLNPSMPSMQGGFNFDHSQAAVSSFEPKKSNEPNISNSPLTNTLNSTTGSFIAGKSMDSSTGNKFHSRPLIQSTDQTIFKQQANLNAITPVASESTKPNVDLLSKSSSTLPKVTQCFTAPSSVPSKSDNLAFQVSMVTKSTVPSTTGNTPSVPFSFASNAKAVNPMSIIGTSRNTRNDTKTQEGPEKDTTKELPVIAESLASTTNNAIKLALSSSSTSTHPGLAQSTVIATASDTDAKYTSALNKLAGVKPDESSKATQMTSTSLFGGSPISTQSFQDKLVGNNETSSKNASIFKNDLQTTPKPSGGIFSNSTEASGSSIFSLKEKSTTPIFGAATTGSSTPVIGGDSSAPKNLFGNTSQMPTTTNSIFGGESQKSSSIFAAPVISSDKSQTSSVTSTTVSNASIFGGSSFSNTKAEITTKTVPASTGIFGGGSFQATSAGSTAISTAPSTSSIFGGINSLNSNSSVTTAPSTITSSTSIFGGSSLKALETPGTTTNSNSIFGGSNAINASTTTGSGGIFGGSSELKPITTTSSGAGIFGGSTEAKTNTVTSSGGGIFGGSGGFFSGLGSNPSSESASKNVFGGSTPSSGSIFGGSTTSSSLFGTSTSTAANASSTTSIFGGGSSASPFGGTKTTGGFGSFSAGSTNISSQGFGISQSPSTPAKPGAPAFGAAPTFGGSPPGTTPAPSAFGAGPAFGATPAFGGSSTFGSAPVFGSTTSPTFGAMGSASSNTPTFGSLGGPNPGGSTFGSLSSNAPTFGSPNTQTGFGGFPPANNTQPSTNVFGAPAGTSSPGGASFNSWR